jgi:hypothetical protein
MVGFSRAMGRCAVQRNDAQGRGFEETSAKKKCERESHCASATGDAQTAETWLKLQKWHK